MAPSLPPAHARLVLGIETSCDETAVAVVEGGSRVRSSVVASQHDLHAEYRGVVPEIASRAHAERISPVLQAALRDAGVALGDVHAIAVGNRPGLIGSLLVGVSSAKALAWSLGVPLVGVDHVQAHLVSGLIDHATPGPSAAQPAASAGHAPALGLVVSGGHTALYLVDEAFALRKIGGTIDDALGEAYDKVAAILGLPFPGGPAVDRLASTPGADERRHDFPIARPAPGSGIGPLDCSFSGLKTAVLYAVRGVPTPRRPRSGAAVPPPIPSPPPALDDNARRDVAASFQRAAVRAIVDRLEAALRVHPGARRLLVGGGVTANSRLRRELTALAAKHGLALALPPMDLCVDNAAMIAALGHRVLAARSWTSDPLTVSASPSSLDFAPAP